MDVDRRKFLHVDALKPHVLHGHGDLVQVPELLADDAYAEVTVLDDHRDEATVEGRRGDDGMRQHVTLHLGHRCLLERDGDAVYDIRPVTAQQQPLFRAVEARDPKASFRGDHRRGVRAERRTAESVHPELPRGAGELDAVSVQRDMERLRALRTPGGLDGGQDSPAPG